MRASELLGRTVYNESGEGVGRIVDLVGHHGTDGCLYITAAMLTRGRRGRLLGYERSALQGPWPIRRVARWLYEELREVDLRQLRLTREPGSGCIVDRQRSDEDDV
jgi:hypothetical protein